MRWARESRGPLLLALEVRGHTRGSSCELFRDEGHQFHPAPHGRESPLPIITLIRRLLETGFRRLYGDVKPFWYRVNLMQSIFAHGDKSPAVRRIDESTGYGFEV